MRDPARIDRMLEKLRVAWHAAPDQRLGQLVNNLSHRGHLPLDRMPSVFYVDDDVIERGLDYIAEHGWHYP